MIVIGLSGGIASGKSTFAHLLVEQGAVLIDADLVARKLMSPGAAAYARVVEYFGMGIVSEDGEINRAALGQIVFNDPAALAVLDDLVHPLVVQEIQHQLTTICADIVLIEAIKLYESGLDDLCDETWIVVCDREQQIQRLVEDRGLSSQEATARVVAQTDFTEREARADCVIANDGSLAQLSQKAKAAFKALVGRCRAKKCRSMVLSWFMLCILGAVAIIVLAPAAMSWGQRVLASGAMMVVWAAAFALLSLEWDCAA